MIFKELLDKYNSGSASEEEIKLIEEEIAKHEAIEDYLSERYDIGLEKEILQSSSNNETTIVKRSVNMRLRKVVLSAVSIVFLILFATYFIVSPIISSFYYNPSQKTVGKEQEDLYFDIRAFTELNLPGYAIGIGGVRSEKLGFGEYNIYFERLNLFNHQNKDIDAKIKRNFKIGSYQDFFPVSSAEYKDRQTNSNNNIVESQNEKIINHIKELNPISYVSSYVIFRDDIGVKKFDELREKFNDKVSFNWVGVRTGSEGSSLDYLCGFNPNIYNGSTTQDSPDKNKYPYLQLMDYVTSEIDSGKFTGSMTEGYTKHFISLLKYMIDREKAVSTLDYNIVKLDHYKNTLAYVEKNGINIYGVLIYGEARELLNFISNEKVKTIDIKGVLPSKYIN
ncbi:anti-sigma factor C-terminal domain-containing protein [Clostridium sp. CS001]|uniref:anti sigma factor C-terminal domain-containing protein n=1 Tax=Clostridium sp. CS001 TaxID=2880648 RepID=UPI001CF2A383|nr:anti sigma factor C-terminal domain-containing protein [Clostridium sp. CS001]MCB2291350.1 anti-sigma factor C-terminal domain-containing protein [Clostridium sp. CS001]